MDLKYRSSPPVSLSVQLQSHTYKIQFLMNFFFITTKNTKNNIKNINTIQVHFSKDKYKNYLMCLFSV